MFQIGYACIHVLVQQTGQNQPPPSSSPTGTSVSSTSSSPAQLASLEGRLFFDYNGNGIQDPEEPAVPNAKLSLVGPVKFEALTDSAGDYKIEDKMLHIRTNYDPLESAGPSQQLVRGYSSSESFMFLLKASITYPIASSRFIVRPFPHSARNTSFPSAERTRVISRSRSV